ARAVVAQVFAAHLGVAGKPAGVVVHPLHAARRAVRLALAARRDLVAAGAGSQFAALGRDIRHQPVHELHPRQRRRHRAARLVHVIAATGHVGVDAGEHERARGRRGVAPGEVRAVVVRQREGIGDLAEGEARGNALAVVEIVAAQVHGASVWLFHHGEKAIPARAYGWYVTRYTAPARSSLTSTLPSGRGCTSTGRPQALWFCWKPVISGS